MKNRTKTFFLVASLLANGANAAEKQVMPLKFMGAGPSKTIIGLCKNAVTGQPLEPHPTMQFTMTLNKKKDLFKELGNKQQIARKIKNDKDGKEVEEPQNLNSGLWKTNLDIPFKNNDIENFYAKITVRLYKQGKNDTLFLRAVSSIDPEQDRDSSAAITVAEKAQSKFCGRSRITPGSDTDGDYEEVSFGTTLAPAKAGPVSQTGEAASFNIGLLIYNKTDKSWYPLYIDPNVQNEG